MKEGPVGQRCLFLLFALLILRSEAFSAHPVLAWKNGEELAGRLLGSTKTHLTWQSPDFRTPFEIDLRWLARVSFPVEETERSNDRAIVSFTNGDWISAELLAIDDRFLHVRTNAAGDLKIARQRIRDVQVNRDRHLSNFLGSVAEQSWRVHHGANLREAWKKTPTGGLSTTSLNASIYRPLELPDHALLFVKLRWNDSARFVVSFFEPNGANTSHHPFPIENFRGKVWAFANGKRYPIPTKNGEVLIQLAWNRISGQVLVLGEKGFAPIAKIKKKSTERTGIYIRNKGKDLTVDSIRILRWNGDSPDMLTFESDWLQSHDGTFVRGRLKEIRADEFILETDDQQTKVNRSDIATIFFQSSDSDDEQDQRNVQVIHDDGSSIGGVLHQIDESKIVVNTGYSEEPTSFDRRQIRSINIAFSDPGDERKTDAKLKLLQGDLSGSLERKHGQPGKIYWKLPGSANSSELTTLDSRISFEREGSKPIDKTMDVMFLRNHDIVLCKVNEINESHIEFATESGIGQLEHHKVNAIEFNSNVAAGGFGFQSPDWRMIENNQKAVNVEGNVLTFRGSGMIGHPHVIRDGEISFGVRHHQVNVVRCEIRLLASPQLRRRSGVVQQFFIVNDKLYFLSGDNRRQTHVVAMTGDDTRIRLRIDAKTIQCFVGDKPMDAIRIMKNDGNGVLFGVSGFQPTPTATAAKLEFFDFQVIANRHLTKATTLSDRQLRLLTIPRTRRKPPQHIVVATNGDMLRGKLNELTDKHASFQALENVIDIPRSRISGIVWLNRSKEEKDRLPAIVPGASRLVFLNGSAITLQNIEIDEQTIRGVSMAIGKCAFAIEWVKQIQRGSLIDENTSHAYIKWTLRDAVEPKFAK